MMSQEHTQLQSVIDTAWENRTEINPQTKGDVRDAVDTALQSLSSGDLRVCQKIDGEWLVHQWLKKAVLLSFRLNDNKMVGYAAGENSHWYDKVPSRFEGMTEADFKQAGFRAVPGCFVRHGSFIGKNVILMPSFVNIGAYVDAGTMVDTWATVGSCAQIGKNVHISGGAGIGGVLEPLQANPVIIEDNCFIGARSEVAEGVIVGEGSVLSMGVYLGQSTKIIDRETGEVFYGKVPPYSVVVAGSAPSSKGDVHLYCAVIVKRVDAQTRSKTSINDLLRGA